MQYKKGPRQKPPFLPEPRGKPKPSPPARICGLFRQRCPLSLFRALSPAQFPAFQFCRRQSGAERQCFPENQIPTVAGGIPRALLGITYSRSSLSPVYLPISWCHPSHRRLTWRADRMTEVDHFWTTRRFSEGGPFGLSAGQPSRPVLVQASSTPFRRHPLKIPA